MAECKITLTGDFQFDPGDEPDKADLEQQLAQDMQKALEDIGLTIPNPTTQITIEVDEASLEEREEETEEEEGEDA